MYRALVGLVLLCCGCTSTEQLRDGSSIPEAQLRKLILGRWYQTQLPHPDEPLPGYWEELDYRDDGSCTKTRVVVGIDPRTNTQREISRSDLPGTWTLSGDMIKHRWKPAKAPDKLRVPHISTPDELRVLHISSQHLDLEYVPLQSWQTYSRKFDEKIPVYN